MSTENNAIPPYAHLNAEELNTVDAIDALIILVDAKERCFFDNAVTPETYSIISGACQHVGAPLPNWVYYAILGTTKLHVQRSFFRGDI